MRWGWGESRLWLVFFSLILLAGSLRPQTSYFCSDDGDCGSGRYCDAASGICLESCGSTGQACSSPDDCCSMICGADAKCADPSATTAIDYNDIYLWVGFSIAIAAAFIGLAYMAARLFGLQLLEAWVKLELQELMASLVIAVLCVALIASLDSATRFLTKEESTISAAGSFLKTVYADGQTIYKQIGVLYYNAARISSYSYTAGLSVAVMSFSYSSSPAAGLSALVGEIGQGMDSVANFMLLAAAQYSFLQFFRTAAAVMLPVGIFLRSFSLTRKVGGVVMAAVIASAVIYPASFIVSNEVYSVFSADMLSKAAQAKPVVEAGNPPLSGVICNPYVQTFLMSPLPFVGGEIGWWLTLSPPICLATALFWPTCMSDMYNIIQVAYYIIKAAFPIAMYPFLQSYIANNATPAQLITNYYGPALNYALPAVAQYAVLSLVVFLIPLIIAMVMLRNLAIAFGGEPQLYGISKLV